MNEKEINEATDDVHNIFDKVAKLSLNKKVHKKKS
jgi:hypothetical protein